MDKAIAKPETDEHDEKAAAKFVRNILDYELDLTPQVLAKNLLLSPLEVGIECAQNPYLKNIDAILIRISDVR